MTAVELLFEEIDSIVKLSERKWEEVTRAFDRAKEMEKEQREKDFIRGYKKRAEMSNSIFDETSEEAAKVLFIETLKSE